MSPDDIPLLFPPAFRRPKQPLRDFHVELIKRVTGRRAFTCLITGDRELRDLNRKFLGKNYPTDVLSFPSDGDPGGCGDLAISMDRAKAQAAEHRHSVEIELKTLMLHGALHLAGFDHEKDNGEMARAELRWRKRLGLSAGLIERTASAGPASKTKRTQTRTRRATTAKTK
jgi:probable rRNA maturation factor